MDPSGAAEGSINALTATNGDISVDIYYKRHFSMPLKVLFSNAPQFKQWPHQFCYQKSRGTLIAIDGHWR
jgi:hypothetical protein